MFPGLVSPIVITYLMDVVDAEGDAFQATVTEYINDMDLMDRLPRRYRRTEDIKPSSDYL